MRPTSDEGLPFRLEESDKGTTMVLTGQWSETAARALRSGGVAALDLNYARGFKDTSLSFIQPWPIRHVTLLARTITDISPLYRLSGTLESLSVETSPRASIELARFPRLTSLAADWRQIRGSYARLPELRELFLLGYTETDVAPLASNPQLELIRFKDRPSLVSLEGLGAFGNLRHLGIYLAARLRDINGLRELRDAPLEELHLESCPVGNLEPLEQLSSIRLVNASNCGDVVSVYPLRELVRLQVLWMYGNTRVLDGDLSPIAGLPILRELRMQARRSYSPSVAELQAAISLRQR